MDERETMPGFPSDDPRFLHGEEDQQYHQVDEPRAGGPRSLPPEPNRWCCRFFNSKDLVHNSHVPRGTTVNDRHTMEALSKFMKVFLSREDGGNDRQRLVPSLGQCTLIQLIHGM